jgi:hypothetical protein
MRKSCLFSFIPVLVVAACGGSDDDRPATDAAVDAPGVIVDASADAPPAPPMITISGTAVERTVTGSVPVAGATIAGYRNSDDTTPVAMATSGADGSYMLTVATGGIALDGYLKATKEGLKDTYLYPPAPLAADVTAPINMVSPFIYGAIPGLAGVTQDAGNGLIAMVVVSGATADSAPVAEATVSIIPTIADTEDANGTAYRYNNPANGLPSEDATSTAPDGTAFVFNVPPSTNVVVMAMKAGSTFIAHGLKAWPDQFTTTLVTP